MNLDQKKYLREQRKRAQRRAEREAARRKIEQDYRMSNQLDADRRKRWRALERWYADA